MTKQTAIGYRLSARTLKSTIDYRLSTIGSKIFFAILCWAMFACSDGSIGTTDEPSVDAGTTGGSTSTTHATGGQSSAGAGGMTTGGSGSTYDVCWCADYSNTCSAQAGPVIDQPNCLIDTCVPSNPTQFQQVAGSCTAIINLTQCPGSYSCSRCPGQQPATTDTLVKVSAQSWACSATLL